MAWASRRLVGGGICLALASVTAGCGAGGGAASASAPQLASVAPATTDVAAGGQAHLRGSGFTSLVPPLLVLVGSRGATPSVQTDEVLLFDVPPAEAPGTVDVTLVTGAGVLVLPRAFTYTPSPPPAPPPPTLAFSPGVGSYVPGLGGTRIDLTLADFGPLSAPAVSFGGFPAASVTVVGPDAVRVEVPGGPLAGAFVTVLLTDGVRQVSAPGFRIQGVVAPGSLTVNEFLASPGTLDANRDGTASTSGDEFVELVNRGPVPVDLTFWTVHDGAALRHTFPNPTTVPAGGSIVVFGSGNPTYFPPRHASGHAQVASTGDLGLNNTSDTITLRDVAATLIAQTVYASADVTAGKSRNAASDGGSLPAPAASVDYAPHDTVSGASGPVSPGTRVGGQSFP